MLRDKALVIMLFFFLVWFQTAVNLDAAKAETVG